VRAGAILLAVVTACAAAALPAAAGDPVRVTVLADSVGSALLWDPGPFADFSAGLDVRGDAFGCRKLVVPGCPSEAGGNPPSVLETINARGTDLGPVVVIDAGYNDPPATFGDALESVLKALVANGVQRVVWVTLNETEGVWRQSNEIIRAAPARWPQLAVADWGRVRLDPSWIQEDGVHFNHDGAVAFGRFLRPIVLAQVQLVVDTLPPVMRLPTAIHARATSAKGRVIRIEPVAVDGTDGVVPVMCTPASPHRFPVGRTRVTCSAADKAGNEVSGSFDVYVTRARKSAAAHS
jgi:HYR domain